MIKQTPHRRAGACLLGVLGFALLVTGPALAQEPGAASELLAGGGGSEGNGEGEAWRSQVEELSLANDELARQNALLRDRVGDLRQQLELAERAGFEQRTRDQRRWFVTGAGVLLAGLLLGLLLSRLRLRRRSRWGDL